MALSEEKKQYISKILRYVNIGIGVLCLVFVLQLLLSFSGDEEHAVSSGQRVKVDIASAEIVMRSNEAELEEQKKAEEEAAKNEQTAEDEFVGNNGDQPKLAIVVVNVGMNKVVSEAALRLPSVVGISLSPYIFNADSWVAKISESNHELYLDLPMETDDYPRSDVGPYALLSHVGKIKNMFRLKSTLSTTDKYLGVITSVDEKVTKTLQAIVPIIDELRKQKTVFIYNQTPTNSFIHQEARSVGLSTINKYHVIDKELSKEAIDKELASILEEIESGEGDVLVLARATALGVNRLQNWLQELKAKKIYLSKISDLVEKN